MPKWTMSRVCCLLAVAVSLQLFICSGLARSAQVDGTLTEDRIGGSVVRAVLAKIDVSASDIFKDNTWSRRTSDRNLVLLFLRRMAYVETADGRNSGRPGGLGIWNIDRNIFDMINSSVCDGSNEPRQTLNSILNTDWCSIQHSKMSVPMFCGIATTLRINQLLTDRTVDLNAVRLQLYILWQHVNDRAQSSQMEHEDRDKWDRAVTELNSKERCSIKSDVLFVIDSSISVTSRDYQTAKDFVYDFVEQLNYTDASNSIGVILVGDEAVVQLPLEMLTEDNRDDILTNIGMAPHLRGFTNTADGLCQLTRQNWTEDRGVLKLAIVLTDGESNDNSDECDGKGTTEMASFLRANYSDILIFAVGIGLLKNESKSELRDIASRSHLSTRLTGYDELHSMPDTLHFQICSTMSSTLNMGEGGYGTMVTGEIMRWVLDGIGGEGVTVRFCVRRGRITLYVSQVTTPNDELYDDHLTIFKTDKQAKVCSTIFSGTYQTPGTRDPERRRRQRAHSSSLNLLIEGQDDINDFSLQTGEGNVTFDVNECKQSPAPCHTFAKCTNTDGSFYCECQVGYRGDGFECTSHLFELLAYLVPSIVLAVALLLSFILLTVVGIRLNYPSSRKRKTMTITGRSNCKTRTPISATNPLVLPT